MIGREALESLALLYGEAPRTTSTLAYDVAGSARSVLALGSEGSRNRVEHPVALTGFAHGEASVYVRHILF